MVQRKLSCLFWKWVQHVSEVHIMNEINKSVCSQQRKLMAWSDLRVISIKKWNWRIGISSVGLKMFFLDISLILVFSSITWKYVFAIKTYCLILVDAQRNKQILSVEVFLILMINCLLYFTHVSENFSLLWNCMSSKNVKIWLTEFVKICY